MKLNSPDSVRLAREMFAQSGESWDLLREAGTLRSDGVLVVSRKKLEELRVRHGKNGKTAPKR